MPMSKLKRKGFFPQSLKVWKHKRTSPGAAPGAINLAEDAKAPMLYVTSFNTELLFEMPFDSLDQVQERIEK